MLFFFLAATVVAHHKIPEKHCCVLHILSKDSPSDVMINDGQRDRELAPPPTARHQ